MYVDSFSILSFHVLWRQKRVVTTQVDAVLVLNNNGNAPLEPLPHSEKSDPAFEH